MKITNHIDYCRMCFGSKQLQYLWNPQIIPINIDCACSFVVRLPLFISSLDLCLKEPDWEKDLALPSWELLLPRNVSHSAILDHWWWVRLSLSPFAQVTLGCLFSYETPRKSVPLCVCYTVYVFPEKKAFNKHGEIMMLWKHISQKTEIRCNGVNYWWCSGME